jgi:hypothetical protein
MSLLRLFGYVLLYLALGLMVYGITSSNSTMLYLALAAAIVGVILLMGTADYRRRSRSDYSDWWGIIECLELPFYIIRWILRKIWHVFD